MSIDKEIKKFLKKEKKTYLGDSDKLLPFYLVRKSLGLPIDSRYNIFGGGRNYIYHDINGELKKDEVPCRKCNNSDYVVGEYKNAFERHMYRELYDDEDDYDVTIYEFSICLCCQNIKTKPVKEYISYGNV